MRSRFLINRPTVLQHLVPLYTASSCKTPLQVCTSACVKSLLCNERESPHSSRLHGTTRLLPGLVVSVNKPGYDEIHRCMELLNCKYQTEQFCRSANFAASVLETEDGKLFSDESKIHRLLPLFLVLYFIVCNRTAAFLMLIDMEIWKD